MSAGARGDALIRRPPRAIPAALLAVALLALGGVGIWLLGTYLAEGTWPSASAQAVAAVAAAGVDSLAMRTAGIVLALVGLALLVAAFVPGRPSRLPILGDDIPGQTAVPHRDLARRIARRAETVDGVHSATARIGTRRIDVVARTVVDDVAPVERGVREAVERAVVELRPADPLRPRVRTINRG